MPVNANVPSAGESNVLINTTEQLVTPQETNQSVSLIPNSQVMWNLPTSIAAERNKNPTKLVISEAPETQDDQLLQNKQIDGNRRENRSKHN